MSYSSEEIEAITEKVLPFVQQMIMRKNCEDVLDEYLELLGYSVIGKPKSSYYYEPRNAKLLVVGDLAVKKRVINQIVKNADLNPANVDYIDYKSATNYNFSRLEGSSKYSDIFFGPTPHSACGADGYSSMINKLRAQQDRYPKIHALTDSNSDLPPFYVPRGTVVFPSYC